MLNTVLSPSGSPADNQAGTSQPSLSAGNQNSASNELAEHDDPDSDASDVVDGDQNQSVDEYEAAEKEDAIDLLVEDHERVKALFERYEADKDGDREGLEDLVAEICLELTLHAQIEEEIFYPAVREAIGEDDLLDEALIEHSGAKNLISDLLDMTPEEDFYDAKIAVLRESIGHHVQEEETEMFPKVRRSDLDTEALGAQMSARKMEFVQQLTEQS